MIYNNSPTRATAPFDNQTATAGAPILRITGGPFPTFCEFDVGGSFGCTGTKSALVPVDDGARKVALYAIEGPENWFEDVGSAQLSHGDALVNLEGTFAQTVNTGMEYHVFLTPDGDCKGLYVAQKSPTSFVVRELGGGTSSIAFDYRIIAKRKGYEQIRLADKTKLFAPTKPNEPRSAMSTHRPTAQEVRDQHRIAAQRRSVAQAATPTKH